MEDVALFMVVFGALYLILGGENFVYYVGRYVFGPALKITIVAFFTLSLDRLIRIILMGK